MVNNFFRPANVSARVDNRGINILHLDRPSVRINHALPRTAGVKTKIDNKGIGEIV